MIICALPTGRWKREFLVLQFRVNSTPTDNGDGYVVEDLAKNENPAEKTPQATDTKSSKSPRWLRPLVEIIAVLFWLNAFLQVFVFDVGRWLVENYAPSLIWLIDFRLIIFLGVLATTAIFIRRLPLIGWLLYVAFYPLIWLFYRVPKFIFKKQWWTLGVALVISGVAFVRSLRVNLASVGVLAVGLTLTIFPRYPWIVVTGIILLLGLLFFIYARAIQAAFVSSFDPFSAGTLEKIWLAVQKPMEPPEALRALPLEDMTQAQIQTWSSSLQLAVLYNRGCYYLASRIRDLKKSRILVVKNFLSLLRLFLLNVLVFSAANYALYRVAPIQFMTTTKLGFFDFVWYGFLSLFGNTAHEVAAVGSYARLLFMAAVMLNSLVLLVLFFYVGTAVKSARNEEQMDEMVAKIKDHAELSESFVRKLYGMSIEEAFRQLVKLKAGFIGIIIRITPDWSTVKDKAASPDTTAKPQGEPH